MDKQDNSADWAGCAYCLKSEPSLIRRADYMIPVRTNPYDLAADGLNIDSRLIGICKECVGFRNDFQRKNIVYVDIYDPNLITSYIES